MYKILDTNIILLDAYNIVTLGKDGSTIVIPEAVIDEIDAKKSGVSEIAYQAREFGRLLSKATTVSKSNTEFGFVLQLQLHGVTITVVAPLKYPLFKDTEKSIINDRKILHVAKNYRQKPHQFITNDVMCKIRAESENINTSDLKSVDNINMEFTKTMCVPNKVFTDLHRKPIIEIDPSYTQTNYNYVFRDLDTGQSKLAVIENTFINIIGKDTEKELRAQDINPINAGQLFLSKAIQDPLTTIVVCEASAGTGKTAVAISNAIRLVRTGKYDSILYIRASVDDLDKSEEIGFLSGNEDKIAVYLHPLEDTLDFIIRNRLKDSKIKGPEFELKVRDEIEKLRSKCAIESIIGLGMRGRTFRKSVVIIDEAQNQSKASLQKMLTRFTDDCKLIIIGSNKQIDNAFLTKYTNGLSTLLDACTKPQNTIRLHAVSLPKIVRGKIAEFAETLFSKETK